MGDMVTGDGWDADRQEKKLEWPILRGMKRRVPPNGKRRTRKAPAILAHCAGALIVSSVDRK